MSDTIFRYIFLYSTRWLDGWMSGCKIVWLTDHPSVCFQKLYNFFDVCPVQMARIFSAHIEEKNLEKKNERERNK